MSGAAALFEVSPTAVHAFQAVHDTLRSAV
jgi:hypothetical protein